MHIDAARRPAPAIRAAQARWEPAASRSSQCIVPKLAQRQLAVGPVFLDLDPQLKMHRALPQIVEFDARQTADLLQALAALPDHDGLLPGALDPDDGIDHDAIVLVRKAFDLH